MKDKIAVISLSKGILGELYCQFQKELAENRIQELGFSIYYPTHVLEGAEELAEHPEKRAEDLIECYKEKDVKWIFSVIGGEDGYKVIPYLYQQKEFFQNQKNNPKPFIGFSDSTTHHLFFYRLGIPTYYGMSILNDLAEEKENFLSYSKSQLVNVLQQQSLLKLSSSPYWYEERKDFSPQGIKQARVQHKECFGYEWLGKDPIQDFSGALWGGCIETLSRLFEKREEYPNLRDLLTIKEKEIILFLEPSEVKSKPTKMITMVKEILFEVQQQGVTICGILFGKPQDECFYEEYKKELQHEIHSLPILYNVNFGHAYPHSLLPYGAKATFHAKEKEIIIEQKIEE